MPTSLRISRRTLCLSGLSLLVSAASGCGTLLYPERRGQPAGRLDWEIVALDTIGLLIFFVPGVIAFAVDFSNGTIYLPPDEYAAGSDDTTHSPPLRAVVVDAPHVSRAEIERTIQRETDLTVHLNADQCISQPLESLDRFWAVARSLRMG